MTPEQLAAIRARAAAATYYSGRVALIDSVSDVPALLDEVERLTKERADLFTEAEVREAMQQASSSLAAGDVILSRIKAARGAK